MPEIVCFPYYGPNRRSDRRVVEIMLNFSSDDSAEFPQQPADIRQKLLDAGIPGVHSDFPGVTVPDDRMAWYTTLLAHTALLFQNNNGHRVDYISVSCEADRERCVALVEHEHSDVGMAAVKLATEVFSSQQDNLKEAYLRFCEFALAQALPLETQVIIQCAKNRDLPVFQLEREPLSGHFDTGFRVRPNGLLMLGHGAGRHILDGTFCVDRAGDYLRAMLRNPRQRLALLNELGLQTKQQAGGERAELRQFCLLTINKGVTAVEQASGITARIVSDVHDSILSLCLAISEKTADSPVAVSIRAQDISRPLEQTGGWVEDFDLAPDLGQLLGGCEAGQEQLEAAADDLLDWLFAGNKITRVPIIAVTGTNGKTTTSRMINHIMFQSGRKPGLVCTDGIFLGGRQLTTGDASAFIGHARVVTSQLVDIAVLEAHHLGIAVRGFAFQHCDVAVCLNVTEEHIEEGEIETVEEMAVIKRALLERASGAAVLFADDANCMTMPDFLKSDQICLVSLQSSVTHLHELAENRATSFCVLETIDDNEWIILYDREQRLPVIPVANIPATFDGTARFNISNAMHAIAASYFAGTAIAAIRSALTSFSAGMELTPGRMNVFDDLPFRVIIDFAHNPDGMKQVADFAGRQKVSGRKLVAFAGSSNRTNEANAKTARALVGHFDFYFCKDYSPVNPSLFRSQAAFLQQVLIKAGVPEEQTAVTSYGREVIYSILDACEPGDLLLLLLGHAETPIVPGYIKDYAKLNSL